MKWTLEISDNPVNPDYPVIGQRTFDNGTKGQSVMLTIESVVNALTSGPVEGSSLSDETDYSKERCTPLLPRNTLSFSYSEKGNYERLTMVVDKATWFIRYLSDEELYEIPFPKMIIQLALRPVENSLKRRVIETNIFAVMDNHAVIDENTELFYFPYPNVSKESGQVCWGTNTFILDSVAASERFLTQFFSAPFNEDYHLMIDYDYKKSNDFSKLDIGEFKYFIQHVTDNNIKQFDDNWLLPSKKRLSDILGSTLIY